MDDEYDVTPDNVDEPEINTISNPEPEGYSSEGFDKFDLKRGHYVPLELFITEASYVDPKFIVDTIPSGRKIGKRFISKDQENLKIFQERIKTTMNYDDDYSSCIRKGGQNFFMWHVNSETGELHNISKVAALSHDHASVIPKGVGSLEKSRKKSLAKLGVSIDSVIVLKSYHQATKKFNFTKKTTQCFLTSEPYQNLLGLKLVEYAGDPEIDNDDNIRNELTNHDNSQRSLLYPPLFSFQRKKSKFFIKFFTGFAT